MPTTDTLSDTLFDLAIGDDEPRARATDLDTSHAAADSNTNKRIVEDTVFARLLTHPSTDQELTDWYAKTPGLPMAHHDSPRKRRSDLAKSGKVIATTVKRANPNGGRAMTVWAVAVAS